MGGRTTISSSETRIEALKLQSSAQGVTIPVVYGVNQISGNLIWYGDFKAVPHTTSQSAGKGGGGVTSESTTYTYTASVMMGLCHGQMNGVPRIWRGKKLYNGGIRGDQFASVRKVYAVPAAGPMSTTLDAAFASIQAVYVPLFFLKSQLANGVDYSIDTDGELAVVKILNDKYRGMAVTIDYLVVTAGTRQSALEELGLSFKTGALGQAPWSYLQGANPSQALGYSGLAYVCAKDYDLGGSAQVENHTFEIQGALAYSLGSAVPDVDPSRALLDLLMNGRYGANIASDRLDGMQDWSDYCVAAGLVMSPALTEQISAAELVQLLGRLTNTAPVWSAGRLKMIPYGDSPEAGLGRMYTPNVTPVYDLTDDHFIPSPGEPPVQQERKSPADAKNHFRVQYRNRANSYNVDVAEAKDQADIDAHGLRSEAIVKADWITDGAVARLVAQLLLQRSLYIRATYTFKLPVNFSLLEPMDIVTLTDEGLGLDRHPVRITATDEENDDGDLTITAEDFPAGVASAAMYPSEVNAGYLHDYNAAPGNVDAPVLFEAPVGLTQTGLEVYTAVKGSSAAWGGCSVWVSVDGLNYQKASTLHGPARYGRLGTFISGDSVTVNTSGQLISTSAADAAALGTLCYIGGTVPEYLAFQNAALLAPGTYALSGLVRGAHGTPSTGHQVGDAFVRVDTAIGKSGPLELSFIGKTVHFKFTSFNIFGAAEQSLAEVQAYDYRVTGAMAALPPSAPTDVSASFEPFGVRLKCAKNAEPDVVGYEWRVSAGQGATWSTAQVLEQLGGTSHLWAVQASGAFMAWVAAVDALGNRSAPTSVAGTVTAPAISALSATITGSDLQLDYAGVPGAFAISGYELRFGDSFATATVVGVFQITRHLRRIDWGGARRWWISAIDVKGNRGAASSVDTVVTAPGAILGSRAEVVDNNALLYWTAPTSGSLPIDRYEVRKGASWAAGAIVGSNGNSTFTAIFEQQAGVFTYWVAAFDSAGNTGAPVGIVATVNQPPDYVLRTQIRSTFSGTATNLFLEDGALLGPVAPETWAQHFESHGWITPQQQVDAGFPLYAQPSVAAATYDETFDYGTALPSTIVTVTLGATVVAGQVASSCQIYTKLNSADAWTAAAAGATSVLAASFRYVRVVWSFSCSAGANLLRITSFDVKLSNKLKTDSGRFVITNAAAGVAVPFAVPFIDADTPLCQANGTTALLPIVDFLDVPNPTGFTVYLLNPQTGQKVTGTGSWTARGY
ncbi:phage tail protein [Rhizobacter sp. Root16D2]|uniref:phage tail protein n=1 Tax=Rhizobacter sp. Root16D2 TaxID=1736479 RepID=UPI0006FF585E|nr:phage tail protein [Rhizobacter sp. Root16D2]KRB18654.1 hypothetical protein ASE08_05310 [Rhizobacter sp. Root16D2]